MTESPLQVGDKAPDFMLMAARGSEIEQVSLQQLLEGNRGLVLHSYVLDFTGG